MVNEYYLSMKQWFAAKWVQLEDSKLSMLGSERSETHVLPHIGYLKTLQQKLLEIRKEQVEKELVRCVLNCNCVKAVAFCTLESRQCL